ncbi:hypothetical protein BDV96DRAFT_407568 [Lophiotrema nucula]|uniref:Uncharacterized protein n=1 Tax=Lophiotrema nucula TaxID=690887 RepID=A0A6A5ZGG8_9PLEO|nr:hypothetical protein BDV96DRAFT_407568 [Lophiotrema nucula]
MSGLSAPFAQPAEASGIPQKFLDAEAIIAKDTSGADDVIDKAISLFSKEEKAAFLRWSIRKSTLAAAAQHKKELGTTPMTMPEYSKLLGQVDFTPGNAKTVRTFIDKARSLATKPAPQPVFLGKDNDIYYYLKSEYPPINPQNDLKDGTTAHPYVLDLRSGSSARSNLKYVFILGTLVYFQNSQFRPAPNPPKYTPLPFRVYLDVLTRKLWIVLDRFIINDFGVDDELDARADPWMFLPSPKLDRKSFDAIPIEDAKNLGNISQNQSPFRRMQEAERTDLRPWAAAWDPVATALKNAAAGPSGGITPALGG